MKIKALGYNYTTAGQINCNSGKSNGELNAEMQTGGYCLTKVCSNGNENEGVYYKITTFIAIKLPVINVMVKVPISGETRTLYYGNNGYECSATIK